MKTKLVSITLAALALVQTVMAGVEKDKNATTQKEKDDAAAMVAAGSALMGTIVGIPAGLAMVIADNEDGSRSCWMKVLDDKDITDRVAYERYKRQGLPVDELLQHTDSAIYPPLANDQHRTPRIIARNRRGQHFHIRPTVNKPDYMMYHAEEMPKLLREAPESE